MNLKKFKESLTSVISTVDTMRPQLEKASAQAHEMYADDDEDEVFNEQMYGLGTLVNIANDLCPAHLEVLTRVAILIQELGHGAEDQVEMTRQ